MPTRGAMSLMLTAQTISIESTDSHKIQIARLFAEMGVRLTCRFPTRRVPLMRTIAFDCIEGGPQFLEATIWYHLYAGELRPRDPQLRVPSNGIRIAKSAGST